MLESNYDHVLEGGKPLLRPGALLALAELDLATTLLRRGNKLTALELAEATDCDCRAMDILLDALAALGYFQKTQADGISSYSVPEQWHQLLDSAQPRSVIPYLRDMGSLQRGWINLAWAVRHVKPQHLAVEVLSSDGERAALVTAMNSVGQGLRSRVLDGLREVGAMPIPTAHILDVGGGCSAYAEAFLEALPEAQITIFDLPVRLAQARRRAGDRKRLLLVSGDFIKDELPQGMDYAWVSGIVHQLRREDCALLFGRIFRALNPGAMIVVRDYMMRDNRLDPAAGALFGINMLMRTAVGRVYSCEEIRADLEEAGFVSVNYAAPDSGAGAIITGVKSIRSWKRDSLVRTQ